VSDLREAAIVCGKAEGHPRHFPTVLRQCVHCGEDVLVGIRDLAEVSLSHSKVNPVCVECATDYLQKVTEETGETHELGITQANIEGLKARGLLEDDFEKE
jgi:hypothetical protein